MDVANVTSVNAAFDDIAQPHGRVGVLVANAELGANHPAVKVTEADWDDMTDVNARGLFFTAQAAGKITLELGSEFRRGVVERIPMGDVGTIADVAGAVIYLASDAAAIVNGIVLPVDGGWTAQ